MSKKMRSGVIALLRSIKHLTLIVLENGGTTEKIWIPVHAGSFQGCYSLIRLRDLQPACSSKIPGGVLQGEREQ